MAETFGTKLKQMRVDLRSIVDRMNKDKSYDVAQAAQTALVCVADLEDKIDANFSGIDDIQWDWQPQEEA